MKRRTDVKKRLGALLCALALLLALLPFCETARAEEEEFPEDNLAGSVGELYEWLSEHGEEGGTITLSNDIFIGDGYEDGYLSLGSWGPVTIDAGPYGIIAEGDAYLYLSDAVELVGEGVERPLVSLLSGAEFLLEGSRVTATGDGTRGGTAVYCDEDSYVSCDYGGEIRAEGPGAVALALSGDHRLDSVSLHVESPGAIALSSDGYVYLWKSVVTAEDGAEAIAAKGALLDMSAVSPLSDCCQEICRRITFFYNDMRYKVEKGGSADWYFDDAYCILTLPEEIDFPLQPYEAEEMTIPVDWESGDPDYDTPGVYEMRGELKPDYPVSLHPDDRFVTVTVTVLEEDDPALNTVSTERELDRWMQNHEETGGKVFLDSDIALSGAHYYTPGAPVTIEAGAYSLFLEWGYIVLNENMTIAGEGVGRPLIEISGEGSLTLGRSKIEAAGRQGMGGTAILLHSGAEIDGSQGRISSIGEGAIGVFAEGDLELFFCAVTAEGEGAIAVVSDSLLLDTCYVHPAVDGAAIISRSVKPLSETPLLIVPGDGRTLEENIYLQLEDEVSGEVREIEIPVVWEDSALDLTRIGLYEIAGVLILPHENLFGEAAAVKKTVEVIDPGLPCLGYEWFVILDEPFPLGITFPAAVEDVSRVSLFRTDDEGETWREVTREDWIKLSKEGLLLYDIKPGDNFLLTMIVDGDGAVKGESNPVRITYDVLGNPQVAEIPGGPRVGKRDPNPPLPDDSEKPEGPLPEEPQTPASGGVRASFATPVSETKTITASEPSPLTGGSDEGEMFTAAPAQATGQIASSLRPDPALKGGNPIVSEDAAVSEEVASSGLTANSSAVFEKPAQEKTSVAANEVAAVRSGFLTPLAVSFVLLIAALFIFFRRKPRGTK